MKDKRGRPGQRVRPQGRETAPTTVVLARWTNVYPLSRSPAERIQRDVGAEVPPFQLRSVVDEYVRTINIQLDPALTMQHGGDVIGPPVFAGDPVLELLEAVLRTDVKAILARQPK